ncbi:uncharacterized protein LOC106066405 [Biomphalaria glabrata]|uniref:Uncharacterized protein LOC106066405 n=1 Tax=Biomphalaria glabrata TaxID=6526 RepID=A0A9U8EB68_BIOGL|nr:uncharacterized protein LOC106066405 [Biomphalaria glabrata]
MDKQDEGKVKAIEQDVSQHQDSNQLEQLAYDNPLYSEVMEKTEKTITQLEHRTKIRTENFAKDDITEPSQTQHKAKNVPSSTQPAHDTENEQSGSTKPDSIEDDGNIREETRPHPEQEKPIEYEKYGARPKVYSQVKNPSQPNPKDSTKRAQQNDALPSTAPQTRTQRAALSRIAPEVVLETRTQRAAPSRIEPEVVLQTKPKPSKKKKTKAKYLFPYMSLPPISGGSPPNVTGKDKKRVKKLSESEDKPKVGTKKSVEKNPFKSLNVDNSETDSTVCEETTSPTFLSRIFNRNRSQFSTTKHKKKDKVKKGSSLTTADSTRDTTTASIETQYQQTEHSGLLQFFRNTLTTVFRHKPEFNTACDRRGYVNEELRHFEINPVGLASGIRRRLLVETLWKIIAPLDIEVSIESERDFRDHMTECPNIKKHNVSMLIQSFTLKELPRRYKVEQFIEFLKRFSDTVAQVITTEVSVDREEGNPMSALVGEHFLRAGSGYIMDRKISLFPNLSKGPCPCPECKNSGRGKETWALFELSTSKTFIHDDYEAERAVIKLFYNGIDCHVSLLYGLGLSAHQIPGDSTIINCCTHDEHAISVLQKILPGQQKMYESMQTIFQYEESLLVMISQPHGLEKKIAITQTIEKIAVQGKDNDISLSRYTYKIPTCRGTCGAPILIFGQTANIIKGIHNHMDSTFGHQVGHSVAARELDKNMKLMSKVDKRLRQKTNDQKPVNVDYQSPTGSQSETTAQHGTTSGHGETDDWEGTTESTKKML